MSHHNWVPLGSSCKRLICSSWVLHESSWKPMEDESTGTLQREQGDDAI
jgi:hypothetical protein